MSSASRLTPLVLLAVAIVGCGGADAPAPLPPRIDEIITGFIYVQTTCVQFEECDLPLTIQGLPPSVQPTFTLASGTLPDGLTLDPATGAIQGGAATAGSDLGLGVNVTAPGYEGVFHAGTTLTVATMQLVYAHTDLPQSGSYPVGAPMGPIVPVFEQQYMHVGYPFAAGVEVTYTLGSGSTLPTGVTLDSTTGILSGTPTQSGAFSGNVDVQLTYRGQVVDLSGHFAIPVG
jgi:hypothetical protein